jgi:hypothetical protein
MEKSSQRRSTMEWKRMNDGIKDPFFLCCIQMKKKSCACGERENGKDKKSSIAIVKFISREMILNCSPSCCPGAESRKRMKELNCLPREPDLFKLKLSRNHFISLVHSLIFIYMRMEGGGLDIIYETLK